MSGYKKICSCEFGGTIMEKLDYSDEYMNGCLKTVELPNIYISGKAGSGKDYITGIMIGLYPEYREVAISQPLYELIRCLRDNSSKDFISSLSSNFNFKMDANYKIVNEVASYSKVIIEEFNDPTTIKPRKTLQLLGDIIRKHDPEALINHAISESRMCPTIISDARTIRECEYFSREGFIGIKLIVDEETQVDRLKFRDKVIDFTTMKHPTETEVDEVKADFIIDNSDKTVAELSDIIRNIIAR